jgi:hypothetical protein
VRQGALMGTEGTRTQISFSAKAVVPGVIRNESVVLIARHVAAISTRLCEIMLILRCFAE